MLEVLEWLDSDPAHRQQLDNLDKILNASVLHGPEIISRASRRKPAVTARKIAGFAAGVAAVFAVGFGLSHWMLQKKVDEWARRTATVEIPAGHYMSMTLQDGTTVWLNSGSQMEYPLVFAGGERRVRLSGEALFEVEYDPAHPFIVETFACDVEVLGTRFDVVADETAGRFSTSLISGSVKVSSRRYPDIQVVLQPNERVLYENGHFSFDVLEDQDNFLWTKGMISIKGVTFKELMDKFEKNFDVRIVVERERMPRIDYNHGKIRISDGIDSALRLLQMASDFTYEKSDDNTVIFIR